MHNNGRQCEPVRAIVAGQAASVQVASTRGTVYGSEGPGAATRGIALDAALRSMMDARTGRVTNPGDRACQSGQTVLPHARDLAKQDPVPVGRSHQDRNLNRYAQAR